MVVEAKSNEKMWSTYVCPQNIIVIEDTVRIVDFDWGVLTLISTL